VFFIGLVWFYVQIILPLPDVNQIEDLIFAESTQITDRNGKVLYKIFSENREYMPLENISQNMIEAIIAVEDEDFWTNAGVDYLGIIRAGLANVV
jgi:membrane carboxypeptidase/penicillin-binding protein